jgi:hypothetical protein
VAPVTVCKNQGLSEQYHVVRMLTINAHYDYHILVDSTATTNMELAKMGVILFSFTSENIVSHYNTEIRKKMEHICPMYHL